MASESKAGAETKGEGSMHQHLAKENQQPRDPDWGHGLRLRQRTICTPVVCTRRGHVQPRLVTATGDEDRPSGKEEDEAEEEEAEEGAEEYMYKPSEFLFCCMQMGNCLCDDADDLIAFNKKYGFADPRDDPEWLAKNHHLFQCFGCG